MNIYENFGANVRRLRLARNMTQEKLAGLAGCKRTTIVNIESGRQGASLILVGWLRSGLRCSWKDLMRGL